MHTTITVDPEIKIDPEIKPENYLSPILPGPLSRIFARLVKETRMETGFKEEDYDDSEEDYDDSSAGQEADTKTRLFALQRRDRQWDIFEDKFTRKATLYSSRGSDGLGVACSMFIGGTPGYKTDYTEYKEKRHAIRRIHTNLSQEAAQGILRKSKEEPGWVGPDGMLDGSAPSNWEKFLGMTHHMKDGALGGFTVGSCTGLAAAAVGVGGIYSTLVSAFVGLIGAAITMFPVGLEHEKKIPKEKAKALFWVGAALASTFCLAAGLYMGTSLFKTESPEVKVTVQPNKESAYSDAANRAFEKKGLPALNASWNTKTSFASRKISYAEHKPHGTPYSEYPSAHLYL